MYELAYNALTWSVIGSDLTAEIYEDEFCVIGNLKWSSQPRFVILNRRINKRIKAKLYRSYGPETNDAALN